jgi:hypothetical protein
MSFEGNRAAKCFDAWRGRENIEIIFCAIAKIKIKSRKDQKSSGENEIAITGHRSFSLPLSEEK